ncbi:MAG: nucleotidyltransferase family protein [Micavibrio aeruginosavorus]|uniref:Nucleotidyltransferase family protein n=1 Tax=Micavibrio aeruginosavorus TaxID=349221 RepID=A0A2W5FI88_9BACT|nr:MAG: nucleotidyltransferase family protein [Micavibrio aeruginosavorus]
MKPETAFILAAGLGTRLKPYTDTMPKPMVPVNGQPIIGHIIDQVIEAGCLSATVNLHHKAEVLRDYLTTRDDLKIHQSYEEQLLDTGGGAKQALPSLGGKPFYMINGDAFCLDGPSGPSLLSLADKFDDDKMDILLLLQPVERMVLTQGVGDYDLVGNKPIRNKERCGKYMFAGIRICHPRIFAGTPDGAFPFITLMDKAEKEGRLFAHVHDGDWHHISTPEDLERVNEALNDA